MRRFLTTLAQGLMLVVMLMAALQANAEVYWHFQLGGMYTKQYGGSDDLTYSDGELDKKGNYELKAAVLLQIPLTRRIPLSIETGLAYRSKITLSQEKGFKFNPDSYYPGDDSQIYSYRGNIIEIPVRALWRQMFNESNSFDVGFGPYVAGNLERGLGNPLSVGINLSAAYRHRCLSVGVEWQNPVFLNGPRDYYANSFMVTFGITVKGKKIDLDKLATALDATATALSTVNAAMGYGSEGSYAAISSNSGSNNYMSGSNSASTLSGNNGSSAAGSSYQTQYDKWASVAERHYNSLTNLGYSITDSKGNKYGNSGMGASANTYTQMKKSFREAQREMKKIRQKARRAGVNIAESKWETATVSY
ncbi:MAG: hypothetical protein HDS68_08210 [Bacteroidales bacterium]|nr:hypothetical protein [Bacteroidales bacterium]